jgi:hypothetical protein
MKVDVRRNNRPRGSRLSLEGRQTGTLGRQEITIELLLQFGGILAIDASGMGGRPHPLIRKPLDNFVSMDQKSGRLEIIMMIEQIDESLQLVGQEERTKLPAISFLNINQGMLAVEMRDNEVPRWRDSQRLSKIFGILQINQRLAILLNGKYLDRS